MPIADRTHLDDLAIDEFHTVVFGENTGIRHPVIFIHRKQFLCNFGLHAFSLPTS